MTESLKMLMDMVHDIEKERCHIATVVSNIEFNLEEEAITNEYLKSRLEKIRDSTHRMREVIDVHYTAIKEHIQNELDA